MSDVTDQNAGAETADFKAKATELKDNLTKKAGETAGQVSTVVVDRASQARDWAADQTDVLRDTVQTKPFIAIGVSAASAFAAGLILGILLTRD